MCKLSFCGILHLMPSIKGPIIHIPGLKHACVYILHWVPISWMNWLDEVLVGCWRQWVVFRAACAPPPTPNPWAAPPWAAPYHVSYSSMSEYSWHARMNRDGVSRSGDGPGWSAYMDLTSERGGRYRMEYAHSCTHSCIHCWPTNADLIPNALDIAVECLSVNKEN